MICFRKILMSVFVLLLFGITSSYAKSEKLSFMSDKRICEEATTTDLYSKIVWGSYYFTSDTNYLRIKYLPFINEARKRELNCNVGQFKTFKNFGGNKENNNVVCWNATDGLKGRWTEDPSKYKYVKKAKSRGLDCDVKEDNNIIVSNKKKKLAKDIYIPPKISGYIPSQHLRCYDPDRNKVFSHQPYSMSTCGGNSYRISENDFNKLSKTKSAFFDHEKENNKVVCYNATDGHQGYWTKDASKYKYVEKAKSRGLNCGVKDNLTTVVSNKNSADRPLASISDSTVCFNATTTSNGTIIWNDRNKNFVDEADFRGLDCDVKVNKTVIASKPNTQTYTKPKSTISSAELDAERQKRLQLERELAEIKNKQKQEQQRINTDNQRPIISAFAKQNGSNAIISGRVTDNIEIAEVLVDGQVQKLKSNGTFETDFYVPRGGKTIEIVAYDTKGNKASEVLKLERGNIQQASGPSFDALNPSVKKVKSNPNALALIIGISDYSKTKANAVYADKDAQQFYDYATMKLGIPARNVKELVNNKADRVEIGLAIQDWIARSTKQGKTDIYIFFAGHGLASQDGKDMFLLPYDGSPRLLKASAIRRKELFANIKQANPRSVTVFLDTCYSGVTRNEEMLIAGRPIVIRAKEQAIPDGFTLFSAASNEQISRPLEEAKHGMFSYFLMKGMEGDADSNNDNKITARELHAYVEQNVVQQSSGSQTPELQGDKDRVLVQFN